MSCVYIALVVTLGLVLRSLVSLHSYSGANKSPMFGDYEAQRHWMEITYHLPIEEWYVNSTDNDLMYWGLDYPPLTAYHSWICGAIQQRLNSSWIELHTSRGYESNEHKLFMRYSVLIVDALVYIPAILVYFFTCTSLQSRESKVVFALLGLISPGLILIDHGHFQYNCVSLGFCLWAIIGVSTGRIFLGSAAFVLALNYKQMELYHALPFFCYLLGSIISSDIQRTWLARLFRLIKLSVVVAVTFIVCWWPFVRKAEPQLVLQALQRLFPFGRGLFEDKVANVWCSLSTVVKLKQIFDISSLVRICLLTTVVALVPSSLNLLTRPSNQKFKYALVNSSLIFFLFSFQVHEKSILLAALPVCLLIPNHPLISIWFLIISTFSMLPLFIKDGLVIAYIASTIMFYIMADLLLDQLHLADNSDPEQKKERHVSCHTNTKSSVTISKSSCTQTIHLHSNRTVSYMFWLSMIGLSLLTVASLTVRPPARFPDLHSVLISTYSCAHFLGFLVYFHYIQFASIDVRESTTKLPSSAVGGRRKKFDDMDIGENVKRDGENIKRDIGQSLSEYRKKIKSQ